MCNEISAFGVKFKVIIIFIILGIIFQFFYFDFKKNGNKNYLIKNIEGNSMEPMIKNGDELKLIVGFYEKNELKIGDLIAYKFAGKKEKLYIKILKAEGGDLLEIKNNFLYINGNKMLNSIGEEYIFSVSEQSLINLYILDGKLKNNSFLIFGDNVKNSSDSRKFGAVGKKDIIGKFE